MVMAARELPIVWALIAIVKRMNERQTSSLLASQSRLGLID
jgi:hypothetical protein